jgi:hypothetical protein
MLETIPTGFFTSAELNHDTEYGIFRLLSGFNDGDDGNDEMRSQTPRAFSPLRREQTFLS